MSCSRVVGLSVMGAGTASFCLTVGALAQRAQPDPPFAHVAELKARQSAKIRELREALVTAGFTTLNEQARALGLSRSPAWTILNGTIKAPVSRPPSSIKCCWHHGFPRSPARKSLNTLRKVKPAIALLARCYGLARSVSG
jgi:hypothetical protein